MEVMEVSVVESVRKWGGSTTDAILDPSCLIFRTPEVDGLIGYRTENGCAVVFGDPVCSALQTHLLTQVFHEFCAKEKLRVIYLIVSEEFARWLFQNRYAKVMIEYGEELILDPHDDPRKKEGVYASLVRRKTRHALHENVVVHEYIPFADEIEKEIIQVGEKWLEARKGPQIHLSHLRPFDHREGKRWFYAQKNEQIVGALILNRLEKYQGWLLNHLTFTPKAPHGVPELLIVSALETLLQEDCKHVTFGTVPGNQLGEIIGLGSFSKYFLRGIYNLANLTYHLSGKKKFWEKFGPSSKKAFVTFEKPILGLQEALAIKKALNATFNGVHHTILKK
jgi:lysylphosphatidylglycerol synthetase-like protein (DUF2156 family)